MGIHGYTILYPYYSLVMDWRPSLNMIQYMCVHSPIFDYSTHGTTNNFAWLRTKKHQINQDMSRLLGVSFSPRTGIQVLLQTLLQVFSAPGGIRRYPSNSWVRQPKSEFHDVSGRITKGFEEFWRYSNHQPVYQIYESLLTNIRTMQSDCHGNQTAFQAKKFFGLEAERHSLVQGSYGP